MSSVVIISYKHLHHSQLHEVAESPKQPLKLFCIAPAFAPPARATSQHTEYSSLDAIIENTLIVEPFQTIVHEDAKSLFQMFKIVDYLRIMLWMEAHFNVFEFTYHLIIH